MHDKYDSRTIVGLRPQKNKVSPFVPYHFLHEEEPGISGNIETVNTIFLTGKECAFKCLMCDLWKNTLDDAAPFGATVQQLDYALQRLPHADVIKLYNSSNFFDTKNISSKEYPAIAERLVQYKRVVVENHPKLCNKYCLEFNDMIDGRLEVAMGLETIHPGVLPKLNKQLTTEDFKHATKFLNEHDIDVRAFILLNPPYITDANENIVWTLQSVQFAFECGVARCTIIPVRPGNGVMEILQQENFYQPPTLAMLEEVFEKSLSLKQGQVFADTWEIGFISECPVCFEARKKRLEKMNLEQKILEKILCNCTCC
ncbi:MAG: radical SAM protein [Bacteroidetes bacterium]|nr:radical SAM protein [Bacteroidota bacterium]